MPRGRTQRVCIRAAFPVGWLRLLRVGSRCGMTCRNGSAGRRNGRQCRPADARKQCEFPNCGHLRGDGERLVFCTSSSSWTSPRFRHWMPQWPLHGRRSPAGRHSPPPVERVSTSEPTQ
ncbi:hypothetical protein MRX96_036790 [Rhipicephalus microplus]